MFITWASLFSFSGSPSTAFNFPHADKVVHFGFYFVTTILAYLVFSKEWLLATKKRKKIFFVFLFTVLYGIIIEILQIKLTHDRAGEFFDVVANTFGSISAIFVTLTLHNNKIIGIT